jgi:hypothetical protein
MLLSLWLFLSSEEKKTGVLNFSGAKPYFSSNWSGNWRKYTLPVLATQLAIAKSLNLQINSFYLQKEKELKFRLATLLSKRSAAKQRSAANIDGSVETQGVEWAAVKEGFNSLNKDLSKLQVCVVALHARLGAHTEVSPRNSNSSS